MVYSPSLDKDKDKDEDSNKNKDCEKGKGKCEKNNALQVINLMGHVNMEYGLDGINC